MSVKVFPITLIMGGTATQTDQYYPIEQAMGRTSNSTTYGRFRMANTNTATWKNFGFNVSELPDDAIITSAVIKVKASVSANTNYVIGYCSFWLDDDFISTRKLLTTSATVYTADVSDVISYKDDIYDILEPKIGILLALNRERNTNVAIYGNLYGADLTIEYTSHLEESGGDIEETEITDSKDWSYTGGIQRVKLPAGKYKLQCWGAQGGNVQDYEGGRGGYSTGIITLEEPTVLFLYVGGQPATNTTTRATVVGGFNGGGSGLNRNYNNVYTYGQGGGGATDIRVGVNSLYSRVIVAGGGGGAASADGIFKYGGGVTGGPGGASDTAIYNARAIAGTNSGSFIAGTFGQGASATTSRTSYLMGSGGGGGGWYGGYAYNSAQDSQTTLRNYNGGGSGYVYTPSSSSSYPSGCLLDRRYYLTQASTIGGNQPFLLPSGRTYFGNTGNGYIRITKVRSNTLWMKKKGAYIQVNKVYIKQDGSWQVLDDPSLLFLDIPNDTNSGYFYGGHQG